MKRHLALYLTLLLLTKTSGLCGKIVSKKSILRKEKGDKRPRYMECTRSGGKISGKRSNGVMNLNITEAVWDHPDREGNKRQPISKKTSQVISFKKAKDLFLKTTALFSPLAFHHIFHMLSHTFQDSIVVTVTLSLHQLLSLIHKLYLVTLAIG